ncbi:MAG TPA: hemerythrin domain-containing protein [Streptosporangiaceae bacterium]|nr:hemerythrin domain-containing protein [Streptosporangiaceae bacterium]
MADQRYRFGGGRHAPAPATRLSSRRLWDESTRPVSPPAPADHVYADRAHAIGAHLVEVHDHLRLELAQIRGLLDKVRQGAVTPGQARGVLSQMTMRQNNWTLGAYCASYCTILTQHHQIEDRSIFPHLRRADAGLGPVVDRLQEEHVIIHEVIQDVDHALVRLISDPDGFADLQQAVDILTDALLSHLSYEEQQIMEPLARYGFYPGQV